MTQRTRNLLTLPAIAIYIVLVLAFSHVPDIRAVALLACGTYMLLLSAFYLWRSRPVRQNTLIGELLADLVIVGAMVIVWLRTAA